MTLQELLLASLESSAGTALECENRKYSYSEFDSITDRIAYNLTKRYGSGNDAVIVCMKQTDRMVLAIMGIIRAGKTYVIVSTGYPENRRNFIRDESRAVTMITDENYEEYVSDKDFDAGHAPYRKAEDKDPSALYYTSGSTGVPKGIMLTHLNLANGAVPEDGNLISIIACEKADTVFAINDIGFIYGSMPMFQALLYGKKLIVVTEEEKALSSVLAKRMSREKAFCIMTTPSIIQNYLFNDQFREAMKNCRLLVTAGEKLNQRLADRITGLYPDSLIFLNLLGCTECGFGFAIETIKQGCPVTCGKGMKDVYISIRDEEGRILPPNEKGEIHIRGVRVSSGYVSASEEDMARFFTEEGMYCYKSGDLGYLDDEGRLIHCGRNNKMVKLHGSRVDLNEVEKRIEECPGIRNAAVKVFQKNDEDYACAFYASDEPVDEQVIREQLLKNLTRAMIPTLFVWMEKLPANDRGKTDYSALKEPERVTIEPRESISYDDERLNILCRGVEEILGIKGVRKEDNFFTLGGDSLGGMTFISYLYDNGYRFTIKELYAAPTIEQMLPLLKPVEKESDETENESADEKYDARYAAEENEQFYLSLPPAYRELLNYWVRYRFTVKKSWSEEDFRAVAGRLYSAHPELRSEFEKTESGLYHNILRQKEADIIYRDVRGADDQGVEKAVAGCMDEMNAGEDSLCSLACIRTGEERCVVLIKISHAIADGISVLNILIRNLLSDAADIKKDNYFAYKRWLAEKHKDMTEAGAFFKEYLAGVKDSAIPHRSGEGQPISVGTERITISKEELAAIQAALSEKQLTVSEAVMYAYGQAAVEASGEDEFTVLNLFSGRSDEVPASNEIVGYITAGIPVRFKKSDSLKKFSDDMHRLQEYQYITTGLIKEAAGREIRVNDGITSDMFILSDPVLEEIEEVYDKSTRLGHRFFMENGDLVIELRYDKNKYETEIFRNIAASMEKTLKEIKDR
ncbi:MAG: AMP-binding protein [Lachnospiraceae bacterium]|nr:AMP-binding protein [Lachnospiraceae bacterium]